MPRWIIMSLVALVHAPAWATNPSITKLDPAWTEVEKKTIRLVGQEGQRQLVDMAYAEIAADACAGLVLNQKAMEEGFDRLAEAGGKAPGGRQSYERGMMAYFGVYTGLLLAESYLDKPYFCEGVDRLRKGEGGPGRFWIAK